MLHITSPKTTTHPPTYYIVQNAHIRTNAYFPTAEKKKDYFATTTCNILTLAISKLPKNNNMHFKRVKHERIYAYDGACMKLHTTFNTQQ